ncbi:MAG: GAF domain-containing sensor histidine kinase [Chloroflexi bacterium]|nr:GAF domain-containing sensor histidine kinase [Chloroflexota bacterium]
MSEQTEIHHKYEKEIVRLNRLVEVSLIINSTLELHELLAVIMGHVAEITGAESAAVLLYDRKTDQLHFVAVDTDNPVADNLMTIPVPIENSLAGAVLRENRELVLDDVSTDPRHYRQADSQSGFDTRSLLGVPMLSNNQPIGVLEAVNKIDGGWTEDDVRNMLILASQSAIAIEKAQLVERLQRAYDELDQLDKLKNDFIAIASHELRTPLSVILGYATFLKEDAQGDIGAHAEAVLNSALRMRTLIEDMTNLRYLKLGEAELQREHIPLVAIFQAAQTDVESMAEARGHVLRVTLPEVSLVVVVDRIKLGMALTNLLNNAIRFTPNGGEITLTYRRKAREVWLIVQDTGVGIPGDQLDRIFEEFYQVEDHMTRRHGGMGLGLSIAKALVEAHGGRLWAESEGVNRGSTFYISLPYEKADSAF